MSILINKDTKVICQGITGSAGSYHARACKEYGTKIVAGVTPGKGGTFLDETPIYDTVREAVQKTGADASMIFVPPPFAADAILEAASCGIKIIICITEGIPVLDMVKVKERLKLFEAETRVQYLPALSSERRLDFGKPLTNGKNKFWLIGPNCPGLITPQECKIGIMPGHIHSRFSSPRLTGQAGVVSRSGTLTYEAVWQLSQLGIGQSTVVGIGGDPVLGTGFTEILELFENDPETSVVLMIGEIGGSEEEEAAKFFKDKMSKPLVAFIAGKTAPPGKRMGHAGAIIEGASSGSAQEKIAFLKATGIQVAPSPAEIGVTVQKILQSRKK